MKKFLILLLVMVLMGVPATVSANGSSTLVLDNKNPGTWERVSDSRLGTLEYNVSGPTFDFSFSAVGLEAGTAYSLIYYANPHPGNNPGKLLGVGVSDGSGSLSIISNIDIGMSLPTVPDSNMVTDHSGAPDFYAHAYGAKIWLVPSDCYNGVDSVIVWSPERFLFETDLITYTDTDLGGGTPVPTTVTVVEQVATIGLTVSPVSLNFGSVAVGSCSVEVPITLTNTGNVSIKVTATPSAGINAACMQLQPVGGSYSFALGWASPTIPAGSSLVVNSKLCPTIAYSGTVPGMVGFNASFAP